MPEQNFGAQIADTTITFVQYQFLAVRNQIDKSESMGALMKNTKAEKVELKLNQRLIAILLYVIVHLSLLFEDIDNDSLVSKLIYDKKFLSRSRYLLMQKIIKIVKLLNC